MENYFNNQLMTIKGIFIIVKKKESALEIFNGLKSKYGFIHSGYSQSQQLSLLKAYCHDVINAITECFEARMYGPCACIKKITHIKANDDLYRVSSNAMSVANIVIDLYNIIDGSIPLKDFPSCKQLSNLSVDDAVSAVNDLTRNHIVKASVCAVLLGKKVSDIIKISDIEDFYLNQINEMTSELRELGREPVPMESYLLKKFRAELGYCAQARLKVGLGIAKEVIGLIGSVAGAINDYESSAPKTEGNLEYSQT